MAVCGSQEDRHGIVLAKNEEAKKFGVKTAETVYSAKKKCPSLVIASPHYDQYEIYSKRINAIYGEYTDKVEPFGIDESWLDVTASRRIFGSGEEIAELIRQRVKKELGITVSIGVSFNKVFAKLGSDYKKPDAITVISR
jgi:DNA polymerase-4